MPKIFNNIKDDILNATRKMLLETGYSRLNMRNIATYCGIATGTLYNYYNSKQEIVMEVLDSEWKMMLRRMDQGIKSDIDTVERLGIIYNELSVLMKDVHNFWVDSHLSIDDSELRSIKKHKEVLIKGLWERIFSLIKECGKDRDLEFLADVICKLFISYSYQQNVSYERLKPIMTSLIYNGQHS
ncbi:MAG: TetR/AcrR family transcriptional regulator [Bacillota bacterium]|nr:TetR/AcrR family transcriptional regulator [Bacillota bacterium]